MSNSPTERRFVDPLKKTWQLWLWIYKTFRLYLGFHNCSNNFNIKGLPGDHWAFFGKRTYSGTTNPEIKKRVPEEHGEQRNIQPRSRVMTKKVQFLNMHEIFTDGPGATNNQSINHKHMLGVLLSIILFASSLFWCVINISVLKEYVRIHRLCQVFLCLMW